MYIKSLYHLLSRFWKINGSCISIEQCIILTPEAWAVEVEVPALASIANNDQLTNLPKRQ